MIEADEDTPINTSYYSNVAPGAGGFFHEYVTNRTGGIKKYTFNAGAVLNNKHHFGLNINSHNLDKINVAYKKALTLNKVIKLQIGENIVSSYKRASSILESELKNQNLDLSNTTDPGIFKNDYEKNLLKKINELKKYFSSINKDENYKVSLDNLANSKKVIFEFFDNVKVNDQEENIKKNRLELLQMLCRTFNNYINFSNLEAK